MPRPWSINKISPLQLNTTLVTTAETVVAVLAGISVQSADATVILEVVAQVAWGAATTSATVRVRRGIDATGAVVGPVVAETVVAGNTTDLELQFSDSPGEVAGQGYVVTIQQAAATGNGTCNSCSLQATF